MSILPKEAPWRCGYCGQYMKWQNSVPVEGYGGPTALDPPEDFFICRKCDKEEKEHVE